MAKNDSPRWIRTSCGYAGRNGYIDTTKMGPLGRRCFATPYGYKWGEFYKLVGDAKAFLDAGDFKKLDELSAEYPETSGENIQVAAPEITE